MSNVKKTTTVNAAKNSATCNCGCGSCSCGCPQNECVCQEQNCQCGCTTPASGR